MDLLVSRASLARPAPAFLSAALVAAALAACGGESAAGGPSSPDASFEPDASLCVPETCASLQADCGEAEDGCGRILPCGDCAGAAVCGGEGRPNRCGCEAESDPAFCQRLGKDCGTVTGTDLCGTTRTVESCGDCSEDLACGGGGFANVCGSTPCAQEDDAAFCLRLGRACGPATGTDLCGGPRTTRCGTCAAGSSCDGSGQCVACVPTTCQAQGVVCGAISDGCGHVLTCNACGAGLVCESNHCVPKGMRVQGNRLQKDGVDFLPRGFNMIGLLSPESCTSAPGSGVAARNAFGRSELEAAKNDWAANTVRFQVSQRGSDPQDSLFRQAYLDRVKAGVQLARSLGLVVIVSMQDQSISCGSAHPLPSQATLRSWSSIAPLVKDDPYVMFELFNEPQTQEDAASWTQWKNGGTTPLDNQGVPAVGHQQLVNHLRSLGAKNVLIADGANKGGKLQGLPLLSDTLSSAQIIYAIHPYYFHIANDSTLAADTANWDKRFGYLTATTPVIATEWNAHASCFAGQAERTPDFFRYLKDHRIGLLGHAFDVPNTLVKNLTTWAPTTFTGCDIVGSDAGELLQDFFKSLAGWSPAPATLNLYFGNTHAHSSYSDGDGLPADHFRIAKANGYDFYQLTDHALAKYPGYTAAHYEDAKAQADAYTDERFVALAGYEFSENSDPAGTGHLNGFNAAATLDASAAGNTIPTFYDSLVAASATRAVLGSFNHPGTGSYAGFGNLTAARKEVMAMLEVINARSPHLPAFLAALDKGWRVAPIAGMDNHGVYGITNFAGLPERTVVLAPRLTRADLLAAMKQRRTYATWDRNLRLTYTVNGQPMGSVLTGATSLAFDIQVSDPDTGVAGDKITEIRLVTETGAVVQSKAFSAHAATWAPTVGSPLKKYYFVMVFSADRADATAYGAPIWLQ